MHLCLFKKFVIFDQQIWVFWRRFSSMRFKSSLINNHTFGPSGYSNSKSVFQFRSWLDLRNRLLFQNSRLKPRIHIIHLYFQLIYSTRMNSNALVRTSKIVPNYAITHTHIAQGPTLIQLEYELETANEPGSTNITSTTNMHMRS